MREREPKARPKMPLVELQAAIASATVGGTSSSTTSTSTLPGSGKKQRSLRDFFFRQPSANSQQQEQPEEQSQEKEQPNTNSTDIVAETPPQSTRKRVLTPTHHAVDKHDVQKRIQYDDSDDDDDDNDEEEEAQREEHLPPRQSEIEDEQRFSCVVPRKPKAKARLKQNVFIRDDDDSQNSTDSLFSLPNPNRIDFNAFSSQKSEPDIELPPIPASRPTLRRQWSGVDNLSLSMQFSRVYSQDELDFLTPQDQPVIPLSHPATPSPMKKRQRRHQSPDADMEDDIAAMDVCTIGGAANGPPPTPGRASNGSVVNGGRPDTVSSFLSPTEWYTNPFAPPPVADKSRRRPSSSYHRSKRHSFPLSLNPSDNRTLPASKYLREFIEKEMVGSGSFSKVYKCIKKMDGWTYAIKKSRRHFRGKADTERALLEVQALAALSHSQHIIRYFDAWIEDNLLYIQLEHCIGCNLELFVEKFSPNGVPEDVLCKVLCHIAKALHDMHNLKMAHLDVKLQNVLVSSQGLYKLGDLGTVAHIDGNMEITEGDNRYLSRELLEGSRSNLRAGDIFALGATIYELALGRSLPSGGEEWQQIRDGDLVVFRNYSNPLQHLIASMMHPDPLQRPSAQEILQHEVVRPFV